MIINRKRYLELKKEEQEFRDKLEKSEQNYVEVFLYQ